MKETLAALIARVQWQLGKLTQERSALLQKLYLLEQHCDSYGTHCPPTGLVPASSMDTGDLRPRYVGNRSLQADKNALLSQLRQLSLQELGLNNELKRLKKFEDHHNRDLIT